MIDHVQRPALARRIARPAPATAPLFTIQAVADLLGVSTRTVRRFIARGDLIPHRIGGNIRVSQDDLRAYLARCR